jgi:general secretion pathway protein E
MPELELRSDLRAQVEEYLRKQGYEVTEEAKLLGKSGIEHTFDMLAIRDDGVTSHTIAVCVTNGGDKGAEVSTIFNFANRAYDTGTTNRLLVAFPGLGQEAKQLARKQRITVIDGERIGTLLIQKPVQTIKATEPFKFETKEQLVQSLIDRGYKVEEKAKVQGRSGVDYTFDLLAYIDIDQVAHSLGIDFLNGEKEVSLETVSLYDTKAYEVGIDDKVIVVSPGISPEARQFAEHQRIKILESDIPSAEFDAEEKPAEKAVEGTEEAPSTAKTQPKPLKISPQPEALQLIPETLARKYNAVPLTISGNTLKVAMADPTDISTLEALAAQSQKRIQPVGAGIPEVREAIDFNYKAYGEIEKQISYVSIPTDVFNSQLAVDTAADGPLAQAINLIVEEGIKARSSDIHIEPEEDRVRVRYRVDGTLRDTMSLPLNIHSPLISRIKIMADMNIADHHRPQDGQFSTRAKGRDIDVRVATAPTVSGEMAVLRLLDKTQATLGLADLGFLPESLAKYENMLKVPYGMILISGPTGAGKTTTLYATISSLDTQGRNIITIEDPAEYRFKDINQIQVNPQAGITFARGLRSILRLDPDVVLVGEIRDTETANIAVQAALTGHMMLTSIHASDTVGVLFRLIDLGVERFLIASSVLGIVSQRMVRRICPDCHQPVKAHLVEQMAYEKEMGEKRTEFLYGTGCKSCNGTGYRGRIGLFEIMVMSDETRVMLTDNSGSTEIKEQALKEGMESMMHDGMGKVKAGVTTPAEVLRSTYSSDYKL